MPKYTGQQCTSCRAVFKDDDDIVVCPECGSPYHRECYKKEGGCVNTVLHEAGQDWQPAFTDPRASDGPTEVVCANCGAHNKAGASFCTACGVSLSSDVSAAKGAAQQNQRQQLPPFGGPFGQYGQYGPYGGQQGGMPPFMNFERVSADTDIDGHTAGEYAQYVGADRSFYYIPKFLRFAKTGQKTSLNFAAFFVTPYWFAYRKMPLYSVLAIILSTLLSIPSAIVNLSTFGIINFSGIDSAQFNMVYSLCSLLLFVLRILALMFSNWLYYKKAKNDLNSIKSEYSDAESRKSAVAKAGGVSIGYLVGSVAAMFIMSAIVSVIFLP